MFSNLSYLLQHDQDVLALFKLWSWYWLWNSDIDIGLFNLTLAVLKCWHLTLVILTFDTRLLYQCPIKVATIHSMSDTLNVALLKLCSRKLSRKEKSWDICINAAVKLKPQSSTLGYTRWSVKEKMCLSWSPPVPVMSLSNITDYDMYSYHFKIASKWMSRFDN